MFKNYLTIALRHLQRNKVYTFINVVGLAVGIAFCVLTFLFVRHEWTYDAFHEKADRIFRVYGSQIVEEDVRYRSVRFPMGPALKEAFPQVEAYVRFVGGSGIYGDGERIFSGDLFQVDPQIFDVFDVPLKWGDAKTALNDLTGVVLSAEMAQKFFGDQNPIGKVMTKKSKRPKEFIVTGVAEPLPANSSLQFDFLISYEHVHRVYKHFGLDANSWNLSMDSMWTFVLLHEAKQAPVLETESASRIEWVKKQNYKLHLQPLKDIHLNAKIQLGQGESKPHYSYILGGIAGLVLVIACINFINLAIGQSAMRAREVGVRKVVGAKRGQLMGQFWGESILLSAFALILGIALAELYLPVFNGFVGHPLSFDIFDNVWMPVFLLVLMLGMGLIAGCVPALVLSRFKPVDVMKGRLRVSGLGWVGRGLIIVQFALSIFMVVSTLVMSQQLSYVREKDLGFQPEQIVEVPVWALDSDQVYRTQIAQHPNVVASTGQNRELFPWHTSGSIGKLLDGRSVDGRFVEVDSGFLGVFGIDVVSGQNFPADEAGVPQGAMIVNTLLAQKIGVQDATGQWIPFAHYQPRTGYVEHAQIVGVVQNFHFQSLYEEAIPTALVVREKKNPHTLYVRIRPSNVSQTVDFLRTEWQKLESNVPFSYSFVDETLAHQYRNDERWGQIVWYATVFAIFVACLGAFGLTALAVTRRTKEIGIRKVLGATEIDLLGLFSREFVGLLVVANVMAWPVAYYVMGQWLRDFVYRIALGLDDFLMGGVMMLLVVLLTVNIQAIKAVRANPVDALRNE